MLISVAGQSEGCWGRVRAIAESSHRRPPRAVNTGPPYGPRNAEVVETVAVSRPGQEKYQRGGIPIVNVSVRGRNAHELRALVEGAVCIIASTTRNSASCLEDWRRVCRYATIKSPGRGLTWSDPGKQLLVVVLRAYRTSPATCVQPCRQHCGPDV